MIQQHLWLKFANQNLFFLENSFYLHVDALTLEIFLIISLLATLSSYPVMHVNYQMTNFIVNQSYCKCDLCLHVIRSTSPKFYFGHGWINFKPYELTHLCICPLLAHISKFTMMVWSDIFLFSQWDLAFLWFGGMLILDLLSFFAVKLLI